MISSRRSAHREEGRKPRPGNLRTARMSPEFDDQINPGGYVIDIDDEHRLKATVEIMTEPAFPVREQRFFILEETKDGVVFDNPGSWASR